jgi:hypothetical protein
MPAWVRLLQPLLSGVFTVDNLDYVRRDAYLTGVAIGPVDAERLRRYAFVSERGLTLYESGVGALEMFLTARLFMYHHVYLHRTVRAIDLDLEEVFAPSVRAVFGDGSPAERLGAFANLDEYALLHQAALWARGEALSATPVAGDGTVTREVGDGWRAILLRRPRWRAEHEVRAASETGNWLPALLAELGEPEPGRVIVDLVGVDARPGAGRRHLAIEGRRVAGSVRRRCPGGCRPGRWWGGATGGRGSRRPRLARDGLGSGDPLPRREHQQRVDPGDLPRRDLHALHDVGPDGDRVALPGREQAVMEVAPRSPAGRALVAQETAGLDPVAGLDNHRPRCAYMLRYLLPSSMTTMIRVAHRRLRSGADTAWVNPPMCRSNRRPATRTVPACAARIRSPQKVAMSMPSWNGSPSTTRLP